MKYVLPILVVLALFAGQAMAADGNVSSNTLAKMGLSNMQSMSDVQGTAVRGMGFVTISVKGCTLAIAKNGCNLAVSGPYNVDVCTLTCTPACVEITNCASVPGFFCPITSTTCLTVKVK
jgi:hypothetical protein